MLLKFFVVLLGICEAFAFPSPDADPKPNPLPNPKPNPLPNPKSSSKPDSDSNYYNLGPFSPPLQNRQVLNNGQYSYGYTNPSSTKFESRLPDGTVSGSYSYLSPDGRIITNDYVADQFGFRSSLDPANPIAGSNPQILPNGFNPNQPIGFNPNQPIGFTPNLSNGINPLPRGRQNFPVYSAVADEPFLNNPANPFGPNPVGPNPFGPNQSNFGSRRIPFPGRRIDSLGDPFQNGPRRNLNLDPEGSSVFQSYPTSPFRGADQFGGFGVDPSRQDSFYNNPSYKTNVSPPIRFI